jgi:hypothetical protein
MSFNAVIFGYGDDALRMHRGTGGPKNVPGNFCVYSVSAEFPESWVISYIQQIKTFEVLFFNYTNLSGEEQSNRISF